MGGAAPTELHDLHFPPGRCTAMALGAALLLGALASCHGFNLDAEKPMVFRVDAAGFGQTVVQFGGSRLVVGAPLEVVAINQTGQLYDCVPASGTCQPILLHVHPEAVNMSLGLSLAAATNSSQLLACGPTVHRACGENMFAKGSCLLLGSRLQTIRTVPITLPECPKQEMDIVFLVDGSGSIDHSDFGQMKDFVRAVMGQFEGTRTMFSLMQYSNVLKTHFTFSEFRSSPSPQSLVDPIKQLKGLTFTATGIQQVVKELFHSKNGARKSAKKILIVITDGQKYRDPLEYSDVIPQAEKAGIVRYAIGVGDAFQDPPARQELDAIGSVPAQDHVFKVDNFAALGGIQERLQEKIFAVEGYSVEVALWKRVQSLVLGAPRHRHTGKVVIFTQTLGQWRPKAEVRGTQVGSYFGGFLCSVDVDGDGSTDLVLVGAPHYYEPPRGGQVSVCPMPRRRSTWRCEAPLHGEQGHPWGRFGAALTVLGDMNGDKLTDVAIGAPGEEENRGAVYIFLGASRQDISPSHSQRIASSQLSPRLQYFGQSLSGGQDLTQDGLVDLAVGAQGHVLLLRSLPVLKVGVSVRFAPAELAKAVYRCSREVPTALDASEATVCLTVHKASLDQLGDVRSSVRYDLALDPGHLNSRAIFDETKNSTLTRRKILGLGNHCESLKLLLPECVEDVVSPITLRLNFSLVGDPFSAWSLRPILALGSQDLFTASLPFEKSCGQDGLCEGDLSVSLSFSGLQTLMVGSSPELNVTVTLWNEGEDSYRTVVSVSYPAELSYRRVSGAQQPHQRPLRVSCVSREAEPAGEEGLRSSCCSIDHPIFREGAQGTFIITFDVSYKATLGDRLLVRASVSSENNKPATSKTAFQQELPVKYLVYTVISRQEESTKYFNFSSSDEKSGKEAEHRYRVNNLSQRDLPVSINFWVPIGLNGVVVWDVASLPCVSERVTPKHSDPLTPIPGSLVLNCSVADCLRLRCDVPFFGIQEELDFILQGNLSFAWVGQTLQKKVTVVTMAEITFNTSVFSQLPGQEAFLRAQVVTMVEMVLEKYEVPSPVRLLVGSLGGGLVVLALITAVLHKLGFFKRQYKEMMEGKPEDLATVSGEDFGCETPLS